MLLILFGWIVAGAILCGIGIAVAHLIGGASEFRFAEFIWLGWAAVLAFLEWWQLALPVDPRVLLILVPVAGAGAYLGWRLELFGRRLDPVILVPLAVGLAALATQAPQNGDSGLYHRPIITWDQTSRLVPGLGNLSPHLALDSAHFLFQALLDLGPWHHRSHHLGPSLLVLMGLASLVGAARAGWASRLPTVWSAPILGGALIDQAVGVNIASDSPDLPVCVVGAVVLVMLIELCASEGGRRRALVAGILVVAGAGVSAKLSFFAFGSLAIGAGLFIGFDAVRADLWKIGRAAALAFLAVLGWIVRESIVAGWPLYPAALVALPVPWAMSARIVRGHQDFVVAWGRWSGGPVEPVLSGWSWTRQWAIANLSQNRLVTLPLLVGMVALILALATSLGRRSLWRSWPVVAVPFGSLLFWFLSSPDVRFAGAAFWGFAAGTTSLAAASLQPTPWTARSLVVLGCALAAYPILGIRLQPPDLWTLEPVPRAQWSDYVTRSGLKIRVPSTAACWDLPPPCATFPRPDLALRDGATLTSGFVVGEDPGPVDGAVIRGPHAEIPAVR